MKVGLEENVASKSYCLLFVFSTLARLYLLRGFPLKCLIIRSCTHRRAEIVSVLIYFVSLSIMSYMVFNPFGYYDASQI